jgi:hypothetical protein
MSGIGPAEPATLVLAAEGAESALFGAGMAHKRPGSPQIEGAGQVGVERLVADVAAYGVGVWAEEAIGATPTRRQGAVALVSAEPHECFEVAQAVVGGRVDRGVEGVCRGRGLLWRTARSASSERGQDRVVSRLG